MAGQGGLQMLLDERPAWSLRDQFFLDLAAWAADNIRSGRRFYVIPGVKLCPECQAELPPDSSGERCPRCVLLHGIATTPHVPQSQQAAETPVAHGVFTPPRPTELGGYFPQLEIIELLGQGGMGAVYQARQPGLDRLVAVKILPPEAGRDPAFAERFTREARALARLTHPNIVTVFDFGQKDGLYYFIMEFVDGASLRPLLRAGAIQTAEALRIIGQICDALQFAHEEGFVHRDIKPENILLDRKGRVKVADFGIAKLLDRRTGDPTLTGPWQVMGTLHYMAPEQMDNPLGVDHRADLYSLGVMFYELLTRQLPLGRFPPPSQRAAVDSRLDSIVLRALESDPNQRYQQARDLKADLDAIGQPAPVTVFAPLEPGWQEPDYEWARRRVLWPGIGLLITGILALLPVLAIPIWLGTQSANLKESVGDWFICWCSVSGLLGVIMIVGVVKMLRLEWLPLATAISVAAMLPLTPGCFLGLPLGLWAFVTLQNPQVVAAFRRQRWRATGNSVPTHPLEVHTPVSRLAAASSQATLQRRLTPRAGAAPAPGVPTVLPVAEPGAAPPAGPDQSPSVMPVSAQPPPDEARVEAACREMNAPGVALAGYGLLQFLSSIGVVGHLGSWGGLAVLGWLSAPLIIFGAWKMRRVEAYNLALIAALLALVAFPVGTVFGIWALVKLVKPEVKEAFHLRRVNLKLRRYDPRRTY
jgi:tRNA A-37 threonylcarbamoyl transferase component Bud32